MRILLVVDTESPWGATISASRLAQALVESGHEVVQLVHHFEGRDHAWEVVQLQDQPFRLHRKVMRRVLPYHWARKYEDLAAGRSLAVHLRAIKPDVVNFHNLHSARNFGWRWNMVAEAARHLPVVWTLHDEWSFTGRCAYTYDCQQFLTGCTATCPTWAESPELAPRHIALEWHQRRSFFDCHRQVTAVTPSRWLAGEAKRGLWRNNRVEVIPYSLPLETFAPTERGAARRALGLPEDSRTVGLVCASSWADRRKGGHLLFEALRHWTEPNLRILVMGNGTIESPPAVDVVSLGFVTDPDRQALAYSAADFLIHPALQDNFPNVVLESFACGTPAIAFPVGGLVEMVSDARVGLLADDVSAPALRAVLERAILQGEVAGMAKLCRPHAEKHFHPNIQANRYQDLYKELVTERHGAGKPVV